MKADVVQFCNTCHTCQVVGKPNQVVPLAPLCPVPAVGELFEHVIVDCGGPLPRTKAEKLVREQKRTPEAAVPTVISALTVCVGPVTEDGLTAVSDQGEAIIKSLQTFPTV
ncbi:hypothetical protein GJAV_G00218690 [Gymnothorax javanicus]|nr:hypothetical protein GJAV_G00218690 [Gymnothorax javanicus]